MRTRYYTATSLDGFVATEDDGLDWPFPLGDLNASSCPAFIAEVGAVALSVNRDLPVSKGCTSPFAPSWIGEMVRRQE